MTTEEMLDTLASNARTALDDPGALPEFEHEPQLSRTPTGKYALDRLDDIIDVLNPVDEDREAFARTLTILGRHLAERADVMEIAAADAESGDHAAYMNAATIVRQVLDVLDEAIVELRPDILDELEGKDLGETREFYCAWCTDGIDRPPYCGQPGCKPKRCASCGAVDPWVSPFGRCNECGDLFDLEPEVADESIPHDEAFGPTASERIRAARRRFNRHGKL